VRFYRACGWDEDGIENYRTRFGGFGKGIYPLPDSYHRMSEGDVIRIGENDWKVIVGCGHSPEHVCLYSEALNLFISGDQVLPKISSNVSVFPTEPEADTLDDWLTSLAKVRTQAPEGVLVLPAHNDPFYGLHVRIDHLIRGHERSLVRLLRKLEEPRRAIDVFGVLFARPIGPDLMGMATGESMAHLNCLLHRGLISRTRDAQGVDWYQALEPATEA